MIKSPLLLSFLFLPGIVAIAQTQRVGNRTPVPTVLVRNEINPAGIAVDEDAVYWISGARSGIKKVNKSGGDPATVVAGQKNIRRIIADGNNIYFRTDKIQIY